MGENTGEIPNPGRRSAIKKIGAFGAAAIGTLLLGREIKTFKEGFVNTSVGDFYPLYEIHNVGIEASKIPQGLDAFFRELTMKEEHFNDKATNLINKKFKDENDVEYDKRNVEFPTLKVLAENGTKLVYGDLLPADDIDKFAEERTEAKFTRMKVGGALAVTGSMFILLNKLIDRFSNTKPSEQAISRRQFLTKGLALSMVALETPAIQALIDISTGSLFPTVDQKNAAQRVIQRVNTLLSITEPEDHAVFFRSVVMADKMLTIAESVQQEAGRKARIAFQVGQKHSIVEDLLLAGHEFTRLILGSYPKEFLQTAVKTAGGTENFAGTRVLTLNPNMTQEEVNAGMDEKVIAREDRIIDKPLVQVMNSKLAA